MKLPDDRHAPMIRFTVFIAAMIVVTVLAGCTTVSSSRVTDTSTERPAAESAVSAREARSRDARRGSDAGSPRSEARSERMSAGTGEAAEATDAADAAAQAPADPFAAVLQERRRRDFPEFEATETGFTITEQVRIGGDVRADYQRALQLLDQQRYEQGIPLLLSVTEEAPEITAPYIDLGIAYGVTGDFDRAEDALLKAVQLSPDHPIIHNELGILYRKTGRFAEAKASYEKALEVYPGFHYARRNLAVLCDLYLSDLPCALAHYETYLGGVLSDDEVEIWVADIRNRLGR